MIGREFHPSRKTGRVCLESCADGQTTTGRVQSGAGFCGGGLGSFSLCFRPRNHGIVEDSRGERRRMELAVAVGLAWSARIR